ncbi:MAG TPA: hypothetical protein VH834_04000 [Solirubrobacteraceae bacterium]|jgi:hypothetical protein
MGYRIMGRGHAIALRARAAVAAHARARALLAGRAGQGTVEYVALILLVAGLFATVVVAAGGVKGDGIARAITDKIKSTIDSVGAKKG